MSNTAHAFANGKALIPFITCGDPSLAVTEQLIYAMADSGADLIELGIPFSDPTAEGPVAQEASIRALAAGVTTDKVFDLVGRIRERCAVPLAFVTYANVVYAYGAERFASRCAEVGVDAVVLPDVPLEEKDEFSGVFAANGVDLVSIVAPTSGARGGHRGRGRGARMPAGVLGRGERRCADGCRRAGGEPPGAVRCEFGRPDTRAGHGRGGRRRRRCARRCRGRDRGRARRGLRGARGGVRAGHEGGCARGVSGRGTSNARGGETLATAEKI